ncbi:microtubule-associated protein RP/EB family [Clonorchis sinensis]|uniref:Microtubule-associated protein RP/EB family n=1 Tax=Clonorchis sinensis TaxID=79923 RepID=G7Y5Z6_CLOSI|nr:microtubule-associated protein RP/EB family [Clonorchis sinensis]
MQMSVTTHDFPGKSIGLRAKKITEIIFGVHGQLVTEKKLERWSKHFSSLIAHSHNHHLPTKDTMQLRRPQREVTRPLRYEKSQSEGGISVDIFKALFSIVLKPIIKCSAHYATPKCSRARKNFKQPHLDRWKFSEISLRLELRVYAATIRPVRTCVCDISLDALTRHIFDLNCRVPVNVVFWNVTSCLTGDPRLLFLSQAEQNKATIEGLLRERDFYFNKLRSIEILCQDNRNVDLTKSIFEVLYATEVSDSVGHMVVFARLHSPTTKILRCISIRHPYQLQFSDNPLASVLCFSSFTMLIVPHNEIFDFTLIVPFIFVELAQWLEHEFTDRKVRGLHLDFSCLDLALIIIIILSNTPAVDPGTQLSYNSGELIPRRIRCPRSGRTGRILGQLFSTSYTNEHFSSAFTFYSRYPTTFVARYLLIHCFFLLIDIQCLGGPYRSLSVACQKYWLYGSEASVLNTDVMLSMMMTMAESKRSSG